MDEKIISDDISFIRLTDKENVKKVLLEFNDKLPPLQGEEEYVDSVTEKICENGIVYCMLLKEKIIGFFAMYVNDTVTKTAFISFIAVGIPYRGSGYGSVLLDKAVQTAKENNMKILKLEVLKDNLIAQQFYKKHGFNVVSEGENSIYLEKNI